MTATVHHHRRKKTTGFDIAIVILLIVLSAIFLYPLIVTLSTSISDPAVMNSRQVWLLPYGFSIEAYKTLLNGSEILQYYLNTILYAFCGTLIMLVCTAMLAYPLTYQTFADVYKRQRHRARSPRRRAESARCIRSTPRIPGRCSAHCP